MNDYALSVTAMALVALVIAVASALLLASGQFAAIVAQVVP